jgi:hypothetical protein
VINLRYFAPVADEWTNGGRNDNLSQWTLHFRAMFHPFSIGVKVRFWNGDILTQKTGRTLAEHLLGYSQMFDSSKVEAPATWDRQVLDSHVNQIARLTSRVNFQNENS